MINTTLNNSVVQNTDEKCTAMNVTGLECPLSGVVRFGGSPETRRSSSSSTWPKTFHHEKYEIAMDGYFVVDDRLYLGLNEKEQQEIGHRLTTALPTFLEGLQNACCSIVLHDYENGVTRFISDELGALPMYLLLLHDQLIFASTYAGLTAFADLYVDPVGVAEMYWFGYQLGDRSSFRNVSCLPAGSIVEVRWRDGHSSISKWKKSDGSKPALPKTCTEMAEQLVGLMDKATSRLHRNDVVFGAKISGGMDSRLICASWPDNQLHTYTFGHPESDEVKLAARLARRLAMPHTLTPIAGDFFTQWQAPYFPLYGITEFFHQALLPAMQNDRVRLALDGLAGDVLFGGLTLRHAQTRIGDAFGLSPTSHAAPQEIEGITDYILKTIRLADARYRPLADEALAEIAKSWDEIRSDMSREVKKAQEKFTDLHQIYSEIIFRNRTRRYIALQGALTRPSVETLYPFLDCEFIKLHGQIPEAWATNKRLYIKMYSHFLPRVRSAACLYSLLPFTVPQWAHVPGRIFRYGREQIGLRLAYLTSGAVDLWPSNSNQWGRWIVLNKEFQAGIRDFMKKSSRFNQQAFERDMQQIRRGPQFASTRMMLTASYCGYFR